MQHTNCNNLNKSKIAIILEKVDSPFYILNELPVYLFPAYLCLLFPLREVTLLHNRYNIETSIFLKQCAQIQQIKNLYLPEHTISINNADTYIPLNKSILEQRERKLLYFPLTGLSIVSQQSYLMNSRIPHSNVNATNLRERIHENCSHRSRVTSW